MISSIVWLIFLAIIIAAVIKNGKRNTNKRNTTNRRYADTSYRTQAQPIPQEKKESPRMSYSQSSYGYRQTGSTSDGRKSTSGSRKRASDNKKSTSESRKNTAARPTAKNVNPAETARERQMNMKDIYDKNNIVAAAKANAREVELDNDFDASQAKLLENVYDVMVKGPNDTISFQRDFLAEGLDMLNSFQTGNE